MVYETDIIRVNYRLGQLPEEILKVLGKKASEIAHLFEIPCLPVDLKISIRLLKKSDFEREIKLHFGHERPPELLAFADSQITVLAYPDLPSVHSKKHFAKIIVHEIVHILQLYATRIPPKYAVWLYESLACRLADQFKPFDCRMCPASWEETKKNFYKINNCYEIAYALGNALLNEAKNSSLLALCKNLHLCNQVCERAFLALFPTPLYGPSDLWTHSK